MRRILRLFFFGGLAGLLSCCVSNPTGFSLRWQEGAVTDKLSVVLRTEHFDIFARPDSKSARHQKRIGAAAEQELARICTQLEVATDTRYRLFLFDDIDDLVKTTGVSGTDGFSFGLTSCLPYGDAPTRVHEMVHLVAYAKITTKVKSMFLVEGLANAVLGPLRGWDVHAVARHSREAGKLPRLTEVIDAPGFYRWVREHPAVNAYDVAGSWMKFLIDTHGIAKTKRYYIGEPAEAVFGVSREQLEAAWWTALDAYKPTQEMYVQIALTDPASPARQTRVEGESFRSDCRFVVNERVIMTPDGNIALRKPAAGLVFDQPPTSPPEQGQAEETPVRYQWLKDGKPIRGADGPSLELSNLTPEDSGTYMAVISLMMRGATSPRPVEGQVVLLTVVPNTEMVASSAGK